MVALASITAALAGHATAASKKKVCRDACAGLVAACTASAAAGGFGDLAKGCAKAVLRRCRAEGTAACGVYCGDAAIQPPEQCDGASLAGASCTELGFAGGALACSSACTFDVRSCDPAACGNLHAEAGEDCDGPDLNGRTCGTVGLAGGMLACTPACTFDTSGCAATRFVDNGDGTVTDHQTGLMWERKVSGALPCLALPTRCVSATFSFADAFATFLPEVNGKGTASGLGGHNDWRLPSFLELTFIRDCAAGNPCIDPAFGPTAAGDYWSGQNCDASTTFALGQRFTNLVSLCGSEASLLHVRAVRTP